MNSDTDNFKCPITACNYSIINSGLNKVNFEDYSKRTIEKMNNGEVLNFIVHCSSYLYDNGSKALDIFEMVECFNFDVFNITDENIPQSISFSQGMIFVFPFDDEVICLLTSIFEHDNAKIITNNMNKTISIMNSKKVRFNLNYIIDIQKKFGKPVNPEYFEINFLETKSLAKSNKSDINDKMRFMGNLYLSNEPLPIIFNDFYLKKATFRCAAIGIVFLNMVQNQGINKIIDNSNSIKLTFSQLKRNGCWIPSIYNHLCNLNSKKYIKEKSPYRILYITNIVLKNFGACQKALPKGTQLTKTIVLNLQNELKNKFASAIKRSFVQIDTYFIKNEEVQKILPQIESNIYGTEKKTDSIIDKMKNIIEIIGNYIKSGEKKSFDSL